MLLYPLSAWFFYLGLIASFFSVSRSCFVELDHSLCSVVGIDCIDWFISSLKHRSQKRTQKSSAELSGVERFPLLYSRLASYLFIPLCSLPSLQWCSITVLCSVCDPQKPRAFSEEMLPDCIRAVDHLAFTFIEIKIFFPDHLSNMFRLF